jgi:DNA excision repair protein ERCC-2
MDPQQGFLRYITITARDKACFLPGTPCEPDACPYARGYYDRARGAVEALLARRAADPDTVAQVAREHQVCPFELSLDTASWCDLVVADYNYVFDPVVRLQRFAGDAEAALLVDESHQLAPRVRDMLSLTLTRREVEAALAESPPPDLARRLESLERALTTLKRREDLGEEKIIERPRALIRSMQRFADAAVDLPRSSAPAQALPADANTDASSFQATRDLLFNCTRWLRSDAWYHNERFVFLARAEGRNIEVHLACVDPGPYIRERFDEYGGHVRFSGTVSPLALYAHLHGEAEAPAERAGNLFNVEQLRVLVVDDVPTYLRQRHRSVAALARLIHTVAQARAGHYLVAFPSFEYLALTADAYRTCHPDACVLRQSPGMSDDERSNFLAAFHPGAPPRMGFVVLGGVFGESVDFSLARLTGVICVGVGLPPPSLTRRELERHFTERGLDGAAVAYHQPAMVKVLQMAGRLLRSPTDRGALCLVDPRFRDPAYRQFFPDHWQPSVVRADAVAGELAHFWYQSDAFSRLRALERDSHS